MKKLFLSAAVMMALGIGIAKAEMYKSPATNTNQPVAVEYGGVKHDTTNFSSEYSTASFTPGSVSGVFFSSGSTTDFVDVWNSTAVITIGNAQPIRFYNDDGFRAAAQSIRFTKGIIWKPNVDTYNSISLLYYAE